MCTEKRSPNTYIVDACAGLLPDYMKGEFQLEGSEGYTKIYIVRACAGLLPDYTKGEF
jgi:hypothetical protein